MNPLYTPERIRQETQRAYTGQYAYAKKQGYTDAEARAAADMAARYIQQEQHKRLY